MKFHKNDILVDKLRHLPLIIIFLLMCSYIIVFSYLAILKFNTFKPYYYDLEIASRSCWLIISEPCKGFLIISESLKIGRMFFFNLIFLPTFLIIFVPYYFLFPHPEALIILHVSIIALGVIPLYLLARLRLKNIFIPLALSISYLLHPIVNLFTLNSLSTHSLILPFLLFSFYYLENKKLKKFLIFFILAIATKINVVIATMLFGISLIIAQKKKIGKIIFMTSFIWLLILSATIVCFNLKEPFPSFPFHLEKYGSTAFQSLKTIILNPSLIKKGVISKEDFIIPLLFIPTGFLSLFYPVFLLPILFDLIYCFLIQSKTTNFFSILAFVYLSAIYGTDKIMGLTNKSAFSSRFTNRLQLFIAGLIIFLSVFAQRYLSYPDNASPLSKNFNLNYYKITLHDKVGHKFLRLIPPNTTCSTQYPLFAHISHQKDINSFEIAPENELLDYILLDITRPFIPGTFLTTSPQNYFHKLKNILQDSIYGVISYEDGWLLLKKSYPPEQNTQILQIIEKYYTNLLPE